MPTTKANAKHNFIVGVFKVGNIMIFRGNCKFKNEDAGRPITTRDWVFKKIGGAMMKEFASVVDNYDVFAADSSIVVDVSDTAHIFCLHVSRENLHTPNTYVSSPFIESKSTVSSAVSTKKY